MKNKTANAKYKTMRTQLKISKTNSGKLNVASVPIDAFKVNWSVYIANRTYRFC